MKGENSNKLLLKLEKEFTNIINHSNYYSKLKISIITQGTITPITLEKEIDLNLLNEVYNCFNNPQDTNFNTSLNLAYSLIIESQDKYEKFKVIMMSDGLSSIPMLSINRIKLDAYHVSSEVSFNFVQFGNNLNGIKVMKEMSKELDGSYSEIGEFILFPI
jgi:hypothetical protein